MRRPRHVAISLLPVLLAGCSASSPSVSPPPAVAGSDGHVVSVPRGAITAATVEVAAGTDRLDVSIGTRQSALVTASTPAGSAARPTITRAPDDTVEIGIASAGAGSAPNDLQLAIAPNVRWTVQLDGGAVTEVLDLRGGNVRRIELGAGATRVSAKLPALPGRTDLVESGGASALSVAVPDSVATSVLVGGGASSVTIHGHAHVGVSGGTRFVDPHYATAGSRLHLRLDGGVSRVGVR